MARSGWPSVPGRFKRGHPQGPSMDKASVAELLGIEVEEVVRLAERGELASYRTKKGALRFKYDDYNRYAAAHGKPLVPVIPVAAAEQEGETLPLWSAEHEET